MEYRNFFIVYEKKKFSISLVFQEYCVITATVNKFKKGHF